MVGYEDIERIKFCLKCAKRIDPDSKTSICDVCKTIQEFNLKKVRVYPDDDFLFDSHSKKQSTEQRGWLAMAMMQHEKCYINLSAIKKQCDSEGKSEIEFLQEICRCISHEVCHLTISKLESVWTSFQMDNPIILELLDGYFGVAENRTIEEVKQSIKQYAQRYEAIMKRQRGIT